MKFCVEKFEKGSNLNIFNYGDVKVCCIYQSADVLKESVSSYTERTSIFAKMLIYELAYYMYREHDDNINNPCRVMIAFWFNDLIPFSTLIGFITEHKSIFKDLLNRKLQLQVKTCFGNEDNIFPFGIENGYTLYFEYTNTNEPYILIRKKWTNNACLETLTLINLTFVCRLCKD